MKILKTQFLIGLLLLLSCGDNPTKEESFSFEVNIRFEVKILDAQYKLYSVPFKQIYFTTYKINRKNLQEDFEQSDTTSCPNGWGVKELKYSFKNGEEKIILGAACENYNGPNYSQIEISYDEAKVRIDSTGIANINKTHIIYY